MRAWDGQLFTDQPFEVQQLFINTWGVQAEAQWVAEHNQALAQQGWLGPNQPPGAADIGVPSRAGPVRQGPSERYQPPEQAFTGEGYLLSQSRPDTAQSRQQAGSPVAAATGAGGGATPPRGPQAQRGTFGPIYAPGTAVPGGFNFVRNERDPGLGVEYEVYQNPNAAAGTDPYFRRQVIAFTGRPGALPGRDVQEQAGQGQERVNATPGAQTATGAGAPRNPAVALAGAPSGSIMGSFGRPIYPAGTGVPGGFNYSHTERDAAGNLYQVYGKTQFSPGEDRYFRVMVAPQGVPTGPVEGPQPGPKPGPQQGGGGAGGGADGGAGGGGAGAIPANWLAELTNLFETQLAFEAARTLEAVKGGEFGRMLAGAEHIRGLASAPINFGAFLSLFRSGEGRNFLQSIASGQPVGYVPASGATGENALASLLGGEGVIDIGGSKLDIGALRARLERPGGFDWQQFAKGTRSEKEAFASLLPALAGIPAADFFERERRASLPNVSGFGAPAYRVG